MKIKQKVSQAHIPPVVAITGHTTLIGKKGNGQIKGLIINMWLNFLYTVQLVISDVCKILGQVVLEESLTKISIFITLE